MTERKKFFGKYRGTVVNNVDPLQMGRLQALVPDVLGITPSSWAMPCVPIAGIQSGVFVVPALGSGVWIEFEQGDPDYPVWVGGFWGSVSEVPSLALASLPMSPNILLQTTGQNSILISDVPAGPGITLKVASGAMLVINDTGILISNGKGATILMSGPTITINQGALVVT